MRNIIGIYTIENTVSGKKYVGSSISVLRRFKEHSQLLKRGRHFNRYLQFSFNKYGIEAFKFTLLYTCELEQRLYFEQLEIDSKKYVLNLAVSASAPMLGKKHTKETKRKISLNGSRSNKGKPQSFEAKLKNVKNNGGGWIVCIDTGERFLGINEAARKLKLNRQNISSVIAGKLKTTGKLRFIKEAIT